MHSTFKPWTQIQTDLSASNLEEANQPPVHNPPPVQHTQPSPDLAYLEAQQRMSMAEWENSRRVAPVIGAGVMGPADPIQDISVSSHTQPSHFAPTKITPPAQPAPYAVEEVQAMLLELKRQNHELRQDNTTLARQVKHLLDEKAHLHSELNWMDHDRKRFKPLMGNLFIRF